MVVASDKINLFVVPRPGSKTVPLNEIKSYVVVLSFYIQMMKQITLQTCLKHSIKKVCFLFMAN